MNTRPTRTTRRRVASLTAATALAAGGLIAGAGVANAAPADPDLTGLVTTAAGAPIAGVRVFAYTTPADGSTPQLVDTETSGADGRYTFTDLDPASLTANEDPAIATNPAVTSETDFKLFFTYTGVAAAQHETGYLSAGLGGSKTFRNAGSVVVPANASATAPTQTLATAGGILLKVVGPDGAPVTSFGYGGLLQSDAQPTDSVVTSGTTLGDDGFYAGQVPPVPAPVDGLVYLRNIDPAQKYLVLASGENGSDATGYKQFVSRFLGGNGSFATATPVAVTTGLFTNVTVQLTDRLTALESPKVVGDASFGSTLSADPGTWSEQAGNEYTYQWLRGSTVVATTPTYAVTKADKGQKLRVIVTATSKSGFVGAVASDATPKVGEKSKVTVKKGKNGLLSVTVKVAKKGVAKKLGTPTGKVVVLNEDGLKASKAVKLKKGKATLKPNAKATGQLTVSYLGGKKVGPDTAVVKGGKK